MQHRPRRAMCLKLIESNATPWWGLRRGLTVGRGSVPLGTPQSQREMDWRTRRMTIPSNPACQHCNLSCNGTGNFGEILRPKQPSHRDSGRWWKQDCHMQTKSTSDKSLVGKKFGRLTIISLPAIRNGKNRVMCRCDCGNIKELDFYNVKYLHSSSCGCYGRERILESKLKHGEARDGKMTLEYGRWLNMKSRVLNPKSIQFMDYGGRGIKICSRWLNSFPNFLEDMGRCPDGCSIDRKDNNGDYSPENCRWSTRIEQGRNRRNNHLIEFNGVTKTMSDWAREFGIHTDTLKRRIYSGWTTQRALQPLIYEKKRKRNGT